MSRWWWWPAGGGDGQRPVLFFPPAGADQSVVTPLLAHVHGLALGVLRMPGRGPRAGEPPPAELAALVRAIGAATLGLAGPPPILVGHSFGGLLAYAVAAELQAREAPVARLLAVTSTSPPAWAAELAADRDRHPGTDRAEFATRRSARVLAQGGVPVPVAARPELREQALATVATDAGLSYDGFGTARLRCPVTAIRARDDELVDAAAVAGWAEVTGAGCDVVVVPGDHFFYRTRPAAFATRLRMEAALS